MSYLIDYHIHSKNSSDGSSSISEICRSAVKSGISEIAITDHFEPSIGNENCPFYDQKRYWADMIKAKHAFRGKLNIKLGVELGQPHLFPEATKAVMEDFPYDYVIGSAHKLPEGMDVSELDYASADAEAVCGMYLKQIEALIRWNDFDCIGHLDLIKRYSMKSYNRYITLACRYELLKEVLKLAIENGKGIEINTSGLRQEARETLPGLDVLKLYREIGGEILTIGSDAHNASDVGKGALEAVELARAAGFNYITTFNQRRPEWIRITGEKNTCGSGWQEKVM